MKFRYDYVIIGSGLFGATWAHLATREGKKCLVLEERHHLGGNVHTHMVQDTCVHTYGPHIFHTDNPELLTFIRELAEWRDFQYRSVAQYGEALVSFPVNIDTFDDILGTTDKRVILATIAADAEKMKGRKDFEATCITRYGRAVYEALFKGFSEKMWGLPARKIPGPVASRLPRRFDHSRSYFHHKTQLLPVGGYNALIHALLEGSDVTYERAYPELVIPGGQEHTIYSGSLDEWYGYSEGELRYRTLEFYRAKPTVLFPSHALQLPDPAQEETRIINYTRMNNPEESDEYEVMMAEIPKEWEPGMVRMYPVRDKTSLQRHWEYRKMAETDGLIYGGRLGTYKYMDMDQVILQAMDMWKKHNGRQGNSQLLR